MATSIKILEEQINNTMELSSICRGEWCRALESKVDDLQEQVDTLNRTKAVAGEVRVVDLSNKLRRAYRNLSPDIRV